MIKLDEMTVLDQFVCVGLINALSNGSVDEHKAHDKVRLSDEPLFSFIYDGKSSKDFLKTWKMENYAEALDAARTKKILRYTDAITGLEVRFEAIVYSDYPALEWVLYFTNTAKEDTPLLENIQALDTLITVTDAASDAVILHHSQGSLCNDTDFMPFDDALRKGEKKTLTTRGGRSSQDSLPFYNLQLGNQGLIVAIGWSGQWTSSIERSADGKLSLKAGMELTHLKLHPGERIRTPRILLHYWNGDGGRRKAEGERRKENFLLLTLPPTSDFPLPTSEGDWLRGQNIFRQFMLSYHHPRHNGKPAVPPICACGSWIFAESTLSTEDKVVALANAFKSRGIYCENFWMDAGWYSTVPSPDWWSQVGSWRPDPKRFPKGLKPVADKFREMGLGYLLWFEPERVGANTDIAREHPEWVWGGTNGGLFKLGEPEACQWLTDYLVNFIKENGITVYRQDFNMDPLPYWRNNDAPDRQGMNEIRHIENLYKFWDSLLERVPGLIIDNCASGGRRLDLELVSRSLALWRTDAWDSTLGIHTMLNLYFSGHSGGVSTDDRYTFRTRLGAGVNLPLYWDVETWTPKFNVAELHQRLEEFRELRPLWYGEFYPLITPTNNQRDWIAYQIYRDDLGCGAIVTFRRPESPYRTLELSPRGLQPDAQYRVVFKDTLIDGNPLIKVMQGEELANLQVTIEQKRDSAVITYEKKVDAKQSNK
ncbi:hypothetical protein FJZ31_25715 [Candidatus Poribacteria bacterium]|nr:hypothetical protein [Candidatus Poribacteria bacterium]